MPHPCSTKLKPSDGTSRAAKENAKGIRSTMRNGSAGRAGRKRAISDAPRGLNVLRPSRESNSATSISSEDGHFTDDEPEEDHAQKTPKVSQRSTPQTANERHGKSVATDSPKLLVARSIFAVAASKIPNGNSSSTDAAGTCFDFRVDGDSADDDFDSKKGISSSSHCRSAGKSAKKSSDTKQVTKNDESDGVFQSPPSKLCRREKGASGATRKNVSSTVGQENSGVANGRKGGSNAENTKAAESAKPLLQSSPFMAWKTSAVLADKHDSVQANVETSPSICNRPSEEIPTCSSVQKPTSATSRLSLKNRNVENLPPSTASPIILDMPCTVPEELSSSTSCTPVENSECSNAICVVSAADVRYNQAAPGLRNLENTCYLNSVLQVLFYTPSFTHSVKLLRNEIDRTTNDFEATKHVTNCSPTAELRRCWSFVLTLDSLLTRMKEARWKFEIGGHCDEDGVSPLQLLDQLETMNPLFEGRQQQDSHEALRCVLTYVQDSVRLLNSFRHDLGSALAAAQSTERQKSGKPHTTPSSNRIAESGHATVGLQGGSRSSCGGEREDLIGTGRCQAGENRLGSADGKTKKAKNVEFLTEKSFLSAASSDSDGDENRTPNARPTSTSARPTPTDRCSTGSIAGKITSFFRQTTPRRASDLAVVATPIVDFVELLYGGMLARNTRCVECENVTTCTESFQDLQVIARKETDPEDMEDSTEADTDPVESVPTRLARSLEEMERLQGDNKYNCERCEHLTEAIRSVEYRQLPGVLTIHIKRFTPFSSLGIHFTKTMDCMTIPLQLPCFEAKCRDQPQPRSKMDSTRHAYELYAVILHNGISLSSGHYTTFVRAPSDAMVRGVGSQLDVNSNDICRPVENLPASGSSAAMTTTCELVPVTDFQQPVWYHCDDDMISTLLQSEVERRLLTADSTTPYMLFYRRVL